MTENKAPDQGVISLDELRLLQLYRSAGAADQQLVLALLTRLVSEK